MRGIKLISVISALVLTAGAVLAPAVANAEAHATYITNSDFSDCAVGGAKGLGYYGLGIITDGSPWLIKGSASVHYQTFMHDDERNVNYCNMYSNSDKTGSGDGAGSMYMYQRDITTTFEQNYGHMKFDVRWNSGAVSLMLGSFSDPTSNTDYIANTIKIGDGAITAMNGSQTKTIAQLQAGKWYTVEIVVCNALQEMDILVKDANGKTVGSGEDYSYQQKECDKVRIWCFGYIRGSAYDYDLTNVTIENSMEKKDPFKILG
ncbi:MAG: hypothetical protein PUF72_04465 [Clostridiales bacterium]|nr:hypothetical protein [Clostridiales bacterium]